MPLDGPWMGTFPNPFLARTCLPTKFRDPLKNYVVFQHLYLRLWIQQCRQIFPDSSHSNLHDYKLEFIFSLLSLLYLCLLAIVLYGWVLEELGRTSNATPLLYQERFSKCCMLCNMQRKMLYDVNSMQAYLSIYYHWRHIISSFVGRIYESCTKLREWD